MKGVWLILMRLFMFFLSVWVTFIKNKQEIEMDIHQDIDDYIKESSDYTLGLPVSESTLETKLLDYEVARKRLHEQYLNNSLLLHHQFLFSTTFLLVLLLHLVLLIKKDSLNLICTAGFIIAGGLYWFVCGFGSAEVEGKGVVDLSGGSISREKVEDTYKQYWSFFLRPKEIENPDKVPAFVDTFYNLVTDIYEWGCGQSFHFSPSILVKSHKDATRLHEEMAVDLINVKSGDKILDVGCGVGGPMRAIASHSKANVVGITINEYQVKRAKIHNQEAGLDSLCEVVWGNFLKMPFEDNTFDGAYSIEATCHAPKLEEVYSENFRVLKPGSMYVSYEWVTTDKYVAENSEHVEIIQGIERGDALPG